MPSRKQIALILLEGDTEEEFYSKLASIHFPRQRKEIRNLRGNFNINTKIIHAAKFYSRIHPDEEFDIYVCIDRERTNYPPFNERLVLPELQQIKQFKNLFPVIAILMIESLFFIDIDGIYTFLRARKSLRNPKKYNAFRSLSADDLTSLFKQFGKIYYKGHRCKNFVEALDINKIIAKASELSKMLENIKIRS
jgi:hypothetical protein